MTQQEQNQTQWSLKDGIMTATIKADPNTVLSGPEPTPVSIDDLPKSEIPLMSDAEAKKIEADEKIKDRRASRFQVEDYNPMPEVSLQDRLRAFAKIVDTKEVFAIDAAISLLNGAATMIDRLQDMAAKPPMPAVPTSSAVRSDEEFLELMLRAERHPIRRWFSHLAYNIGDWLQP